MCGHLGVVPFSLRQRVAWLPGILVACLRCSQAKVPSATKRASRDLISALRRMRLMSPGLLPL